MRRHDKKIAMKKANILLEQRNNIKETIKASEAYTDMDAMMSVINGKRSVAFLLAPELSRNIEIYNQHKDKVGLMVVKRDGQGMYGDGYIMYTDPQRAKHLHDVMAKHDGYLSDDTPEEAIENGEALEYDDNDIKEFTDSHYGVGSYDKVKNINYEKVR